MLKNSENNGTEEIGLVTPTRALVHIISMMTQFIDMSLGLSVLSHYIWN